MRGRGLYVAVSAAPVHLLVASTVSPELLAALAEDAERVLTARVSHVAACACGG